MVSVSVSVSARAGACACAATTSQAAARGASAQPPRRLVLARRGVQGSDRRGRGRGRWVTCAVEEAERAPAGAGRAGGAAGEGVRRAVFRSSRRVEKGVEEGPRPVSEYMTLPASQFSVLDAKRIERVDDSTFRCYVGGLKFFAFEVEPVIKVRVEPDAHGRGCTIRLLECTLEGSDFVRQQNDKFSAGMTNALCWKVGEDGGKVLEAYCTLEIIIDVPPSMFMFSTASVERTGNAVVAGILRSMMPRVIHQLVADYRLWTEGRELERTTLASMASLSE